MEAMAPFDDGRVDDGRVDDGPALLNDDTVPAGMVIPGMVILAGNCTGVPRKQPME